MGLAMSDGDLQESQQPLKERYDEDPEAARITLTAAGHEQADVRACSVEVGEAIYEAQLHEGAGGPGTGACSGDLLLGALAACSQLTTQAVADSFGLGEDVDITVEVEGDLDLRGTLGMDENVPVGFDDIRMTVSVEGDIDGETLDALRRSSERYCVVYQTLSHPPEVETDWNLE